MMIAALLLFFTAGLHAEALLRSLDLQMDYTGQYTDNLFLNSDKVTDFISRFNWYLSYGINQFRLSVEASADFYADAGDYNSFYLSPAVDFHHRFGRRNGLFISLGYIVQNYKDLYTDFNYSGPRLGAGVVLYTGKSAVVTGGYIFELRDHHNFQSFDFFNHNVYAKWNLFWRSQTNLRLESGFNYRIYPHIRQAFDFGADYHYYTNTGNHGTHGNQGDGNSHGNHGGGVGMNPGMTPDVFNRISIPGVYGKVRVSQSVGARWSFAAESEVRKNFSGLNFSDAESLIRNAYARVPLNDDFLWDGLKLEGEVKGVLFRNLSLRGTAAYFWKNYRDIYIMDNDGSIANPVTERNDDLLLCRLYVSLKLRRVFLKLDLAYRDNRSNDAYFHFSQWTVSGGVGYRF